MSAPYNYYPEPPHPHHRRTSSSSHGRHSRPHASSFSTGKALASVAGGAVAATVLDKYLVQRAHDRRRHSHGGHDPALAAAEDDDKKHDPWRRLADVAVGGFAGLEAYSRYSKRADKSAHENNEREGRRARSHSHARSRGLSRGRYDDEDDYDDEDEDDYVPRSRSHSRSGKAHRGQRLLEAGLSPHSAEKEWSSHYRGYDGVGR